MTTHVTQRQECVCAHTMTKMGVRTSQGNEDKCAHFTVTRMCVAISHKGTAGSVTSVLSIELKYLLYVNDKIYSLYPRIQKM